MPLRRQTVVKCNATFCGNPIQETGNQMVESREESVTDNRQRTRQVQEEIDLINVRELRHLLSAHGMRPNKSFGQNFLIDRSVLRKIVDAAEIQATEQVLEVG